MFEYLIKCAIRLIIYMIKFDCAYELINFSNKSTSAKLSEESSTPRYLEASPRRQYEKNMFRLALRLALKLSIINTRLLSTSFVCHADAETS